MQQAPADSQDRILWLAVRQGLLLIVAAIERRYLREKKDVQP